MNLIHLFEKGPPGGGGGVIDNFFGLIREYYWAKTNYTCKLKTYHQQHVCIQDQPTEYTA